MIALVAASNPTYRDNGSKYFKCNEDMISQGSILSGPAVLGTEPEEIVIFTDSLIINRSLIWNNMVAIFQGSDAWTYLNPAKKHCDGRLGFWIIYNHCLDPITIDHMASVV